MTDTLRPGEAAGWERRCPGVIRPPATRRVRQVFLWGAAGLFTLWCFAHLGFSPARLWAGLGKLGWLIGFMLPPAHNGWLPDFAYGLAETVAMALLATVFASLAAVPFGFLCARTTLPYRGLTFSLRRLSDAIRGIDALIWALIFVNVVGLGPFAGVLALAIHNTGDLAKLYSEAIENIDRRQMEGIRATGGSRFAVVRFGVLPQILPTLLSQSLYYFESNTRSATIIGAVGAGGLGLLLTERIRLYHWDEVAFLILMILAAVFVIDTLSKLIRDAVIKGQPAPLIASPA
jgi:phosphonate transport system permease protein